MGEMGVFMRVRVNDVCEVAPVPQPTAVVSHFTRLGRTGVAMNATGSYKAASCAEPSMRCQAPLQCFR